MAVILLISCKKSDDNAIRSCTKDYESHTNENGTSIELSSQIWHLEDMGKGGSIELTVSGTTNGDSAIILSYGDGLISEVPIVLDNQKHFEQNLGISFTATSKPEGNINCGTIITVYRTINKSKQLDTLMVMLNSCTLRY